MPVVAAGCLGAYHINERNALAPGPGTELYCSAWNTKDTGAREDRYRSASPRFSPVAVRDNNQIYDVLLNALLILNEKSRSKALHIIPAPTLYSYAGQ